MMMFLMISCLVWWSHIVSKSETDWVPPNALTLAGWILYTLMLWGRNQAIILTFSFKISVWDIFLIYHDVFRAEINTIEEQFEMLLNSVYISQYASDLVTTIWADNKMLANLGVLAWEKPNITHILFNHTNQYVKRFSEILTLWLPTTIG